MKGARKFKGIIPLYNDVLFEDNETLRTGATITLSGKALAEGAMARFVVQRATEPTIDLNGHEVHVHNEGGFDGSATYNKGTIYVAGEYPDVDGQQRKTLVVTWTPVVITDYETVPNAPSSLSATAISATQVDLSWTDNSTNETSFILERSPQGAGTWVAVDASIEPEITSYSDNTVLAETAYDYRVKSQNAIGDSAYSNTATVTTPAAVSSTNYLFNFGGVGDLAANTLSWNEITDPAAMTIANFVDEDGNTSTKSFSLSGAWSSLATGFGDLTGFGTFLGIDMAGVGSNSMRDGGGSRGGTGVFSGLDNTKTYEVYACVASGGATSGGTGATPGTGIRVLVSAEGEDTEIYFNESDSDTFGWVKLHSSNNVINPDINDEIHIDIREFGGTDPRTSSVYITALYLKEN